jgi:ADP-dependent NAD(P)H-hydrate dehydratase / NAD(P)H-hydrate epimerase
MRLVSVQQMKAIEKEADAAGLTYAQMMQNAGQGLAEVVQDLPIEDSEQEVFGLVGSGNNGGDTLVALAHLAADGWRARAYLINRKSDSLVERLEKAGGEIIVAEEDEEFASLSAFVQTATVLLDGVLGTGAKLPLKDEVADVLSEVRAILEESEYRPVVVAVDCPSGMDCDTGEAAAECLNADVTVTMAAVKQGMLKMPAYELIGNLEVIDIGLPDDLQSLQLKGTEVAEEEMVAQMLPERPIDAHKGTFGTALVTAGSVNYTGAAMLAGKAAYRVGAGLVTLAVPAPLHNILASQFPEATWVLLPHQMGVISRDAAEVLIKNMERATALLLGPGFGTEETTREFLANLLSGQSARKKPAGRIGFLPGEAEKAEDKANKWPGLVVDADGLRHLAKIEGWSKLLPGEAVLTPHPGEMSALTGLEVDEIQKDRQATAVKFAKEWGHVVVLKGAFTVIASPDGRTVIIPVASPALARAGTGDVLAGAIVGLRAQGVEPFEAAVAGAWIHAQAGLYAADDLGSSASVVAGDVLDSISDVMSDLSYTQA